MDLRLSGDPGEGGWPSPTHPEGGETSTLAAVVMERDRK